MKELIAISAVLCAVSLTTMADTSGMSFWKNGDSSVTNRADAAGVSLRACSTAFSTTSRSDTVEITGLSLDTRPRGIVIIVN